MNENILERRMQLELRKKVDNLLAAGFSVVRDQDENFIQLEKETAMLKLFFKRKILVTLSYSNHHCDRVKVRRAIAEGFHASFNGAFWVLTKVI